VYLLVEDKSLTLKLVASPSTEFVIDLKLNHREPHQDHQITVPERCDYCDCPNFKIWGTRIQGRISLEARCCKCGKIVNTIVCERQIAE